MARSRDKSTKISHYDDDWSHTRVDLYVNLQTGHFYAKVGQAYLEAPSLDQLRKVVSDYFDEHRDFTWVPYIVVTEVEPQLPWAMPEAFLGFYVNRGYFAEQATGHLLVAPWDAPESGNRFDFAQESHFLPASDRPLHLPRRWAGQRGEYWLPYTDAVWMALNEMSTRLAALARKFREIVSTEAGVAQLAERGTRALLEAGPDAPKDVPDDS